MLQGAIAFAALPSQLCINLLSCNVGLTDVYPTLASKDLIKFQYFNWYPLKVSISALGICSISINLQMLVFSYETCNSPEFDGARGFAGSDSKMFIFLKLTNKFNRVWI